MTSSSGKAFGLVLLLALVAGIGYLATRVSPPPPLPPATAAAPATLATTMQQATTQRSPRHLVDLVLEQDPDFPTTQALAIPGTLADAARIILHQPVYLCPRRDLWITDPNADPIRSVLSRADEEQTHVTRETIRFVHWTYDDNGKATAAIVVSSGDGRHELVTASRRVLLAFSDTPFWQSAASWNDRIVVPSASGIAVISGLSGEIQIDYQALAPEGDRPQFAFDPHGILAWTAPTKPGSGARGAWRYIGGKWTHLNTGPWDGNIQHLIPLLDGSVLIVRQEGNARVALAQLQGDAEQNPRQVQIDEARITALVGELSNRDPVLREQAFAELARFGAGASAVLERLRDQQPPGARLRIDEILNTKLEQRLGTLRLEDGPLEVAARFDDGGRVYYFESGVSVFSENVGPQRVAPAWISVRPGRAVRLLPPLLTEDFARDRQQLQVIADEWFVTDPISGPRRFIGNHFQKPLRKRESRFWNVLGIDRRGRWLYTDPQRSGTLIIDPTLPDPKPRLIVWEYPVREGQVGWTQDNWPAIKRPGAWALKESAWQAIDEKKDQFIISVPAPATATSQPAPILVEKDGTRWMDGVDHLIKQTADGRKLDWELPGIAAGGSKAILFRINPTRLFLFNQTGRVVCIRETPLGTEPFKVESIFTDKVPDTDSVERLWQDPSGRIIIARGDTLWILFPEGNVSEAIQNMMPPGTIASEED